MNWPARLALLPALLFALVPSPAEAETPDSLEAVRELYFAAVQEESAIPRGLQAILELRASGAAPTGGTTDVVLSAYQGALITLRAKHGFWPPDRLRHLREGLGILDQAVAARPEHPEIRYLRLLSCYFLPGILGRGGSVREDFGALARLLPSARDAFAPDLYRMMVAFVLEHGALEAPELERLQDAVDPEDDG